MRLGFSDWQDKSVREINRGMMEQRFHELSEKGHAQANQMFRFLWALLNFAMEKCATDFDSLWRDIYNPSCDLHCETRNTIG
jgi:hypothetical protein